MPQRKHQDIIDNGHVTKIELELEEAPDDLIPVESVPLELNATAEINSTYPDGIPRPGAIVVRAEEALIVILVLFLWAAAIALFFNRWGKIRMLEPYQPKFQQQHRPSCTTIEQNPLQNRRTYSKCNVLCGDYPARLELNSDTGQTRPRQNSVFIGTSASLLPGGEGTPRRTKSALDLQCLVYGDCSSRGSGGGEQDAARTAKGVTESTKLLPSRERKTSVCQFDRNDAWKPSFRDRGMSICQLEAVATTSSSSSSFFRDRGMSVCQFDRMDVLARPLQRDRGGSICHFDRTDVFARPLQRDRVGSAYHFDRTEVLARPNFSMGRSLSRERRVSACNFLEKEEEEAEEEMVSNATQQKRRRSNINNTDKIQRETVTSIEKIEDDTEGREIFAKCTPRRDTHTAYRQDQPSCSKTVDVGVGYKATCV